MDLNRFIYVGTPTCPESCASQFPPLQYNEAHWPEKRAEFNPSKTKVSGATWSVDTPSTDVTHLDQGFTKSVV